MKRKTSRPEELDWARKTLGLGRRATLEEIKSAYREACKKWHPDYNPDHDKSDLTKHMQDINKAYQILMEYIENYRYLLVPDVEENFDPESWWWEKFGSAFAGSVKRKKSKD